MAEGKGFEPLNAFDVSRFQDARLRPLGQPSIKIIKFLGAKSSENDFVEKFVEFYFLVLPL